MDIISLIIGFILGFIGSFFGALFTHLFSECRRKKERFDNACNIFRGKILYELSGFYPGEHWRENEWPRIYQSIPRISCAAAEFRYFVTDKEEFDIAINEYNKYCRETTKNEAFNMLHFPSTPGGKSSKDYKKEFKNIVDHLLSFANEK